MNWQDVALGLAGVVGCGVAVFHGVLVQRLMVQPIERTAEGRLSAPSDDLCRRFCNSARSIGSSVALP